jgi:hypothetical protein
MQALTKHGAQIIYKFSLKKMGEFATGEKQKTIEHSWKMTTGMIQMYLCFILSIKYEILNL